MSREIEHLPLFLAGENTSNGEQWDHDRLENRPRSEAPHRIFVHFVLIIRRKYGPMMGKCVTLDGDGPFNV